MRDIDRRNFWREVNEENAQRADTTPEEALARHPDAFGDVCGSRLTPAHEHFARLTRARMHQAVMRGYFGPYDAEADYQRHRVVVAAIRRWRELADDVVRLLGETA